MKRPLSHVLQDILFSLALGLIGAWVLLSYL